MTAAPARHEPRFVYLSEAGAVAVQSRRPAATDEADDPDARFRWRLDAANHRPLGQSAEVTGSLDTCRAGAQLARANVDRLVGAMAAGDRRSAWTWRVDLDGVQVAASAHAYLRRVECMRGLTHFLNALRTADPADGVLRRLAPRSQRAFETVWGANR